GKATRITGTPGRRGVGPRLAAEVVGAVMGEQQQAPGAKDLWVRVARATEGAEGLAFGPNPSRGDAVLGLDRGKDPTRRRAEGDGQPASGQLQGRGARQPDWSGSGNAVADMPLPLAGWGKTPGPVGWGRGGNGQSHHGLGGCAPASETPGMCARDLQWG